MVLAAEGRKANDSHADCYQYFCVPEYGTANGRLHFHAVHFMRTLPTGRDRKSGSAGMPRPISYAVFCLKKKKKSNCREIDKCVGMYLIVGGVQRERAQ